MSFCRWFWFLSHPTRPIRNRRLRLESLEDRTLPATINWSGGSGNWDVAANWSGGKVPGSNDDAVISTGSTATITIISGDNIQVQSATTAATDTLSITGGSLSIAGNSTLDGALAMTGGSLTASGSGTTFLENGSTSVAAASLYATAGATLSLPNLTGYTGNSGTTTLEATGTGSTLTLANLTGVTQTGTGYGAQTQFEVLAGGTVNLPALQQINTGTVGLESDGAGSVLNVAALTSFAETNGWTYSTLQSSNGGTVNDGSLASLSNVNLNVGGTGENLTLSGLTSFATANITVSGGASLSLPGVTSFTGNSISTLPSTTTLEATGTGSTLTLANLAGVTQTGTGYAVQTQFEALAGGTVNLPALQQINTGTVVLESDGAGSVLNVSALTSFAEANGWTSSTLQSSSGGTISDGSLASLTNVDLNVIGTGENLTLSGLTTIATANIAVATANITVSGGASLSLPGVTSYAGSGNTTTLEATGTGSTLTLANLTGVTQSANNYSAQTQFEALAGGTVNLPALQQINTGTVVLVSDGAGSVLKVSALTSFTETNGHTYSTFQSSNGGTVNDGSLTSTHGIYFTDTGGSTILDGKLSSLTNVTVTLDGSDAHVADSWTKFINGSLEVDVGSYSLANLINIDGSSLYARFGGSLALPGLTSYASNGTFQADGTNTGTGAGSVLDVSALLSLTQTGGWTVNALTGGTVKLSSLNSLTSTQGINITDTGNSTLLDSNLTTLNGVIVSTDGTDAQVGNSWTTFIKGTLSLSGGTLTLPNLTDLENSNLQLASAATLNLSTAGVATVAGNINLSGGTLTLSGSPNIDNATVVASGGATLNLPGGITCTGLTTLEATGSGSTLTLAGTTLAEPTNVGDVLVIEALAGGSVSMPATTSISGGPVVMESGGANSVLELPALQSFTSTGGATASNGGSIPCGITLPAAPAVWINPGSGTWSVGTNWLLGSAPTADMNVLISTVAAATITIFSNVSVNSITLGNSDTLFIYVGTKLNASGDFTNNGILTLGPSCKLSVAGNETQTATATINEQIDGAPADGGFGALSVKGTLTLAGTLNLTLLYGYLPSVGLDYPVSTFTSSSGDFSTLSGLTGQGPSFTETLGATSLDLIVQPTPPYFTTDTPPVAAVGFAYSYQFKASGTGRITYSATGLPNWAQLDASGTLSGTPPAVGTVNFSVTASNGIAPDATVNVSLDSELAPPVFTADLPPEGIGGSAYSYSFQATGMGNVPITYSATGLPNWAQLNTSTGLLFGTPPADGTFNFSVTASNGIKPDTTVDVSLIVVGGTALTYNIPAGTTFSVPVSNYTGGTTFNVGAGAKVTITSGTFTGGAVFNVAAGAVVDLTDGEDSITYSGTLSGSGGGIVQLSNDGLYIGNGGMTLNFSGSTFQWNGGQISADGGDLTNVGTMNLSGTDNKEFYNDGVLDNFGTIIQTGTGNLQLGTDGIFPATLKNEAGASYLLEGDGGLTEVSDTGSAAGQTSLINAGLIRKTAGTGISTFGPAQSHVSLGAFGVITNTGTIEADSGTIALTTTSGISQISGGVLTAGNWSAEDGASLRFPSGTNITTNAGNLSLGGSGATITGISSLSSNSGSLTLTSGAASTTNGNFTNSGSLTVGAGSTLSVTGNETETAAGTLNIQIGGTPASGQFGVVAVTGTATLAGVFKLIQVNGYTGSVGQDFKVMTFASASGSFSTVLGFGSTFSEAINPISLDLYAFRNSADLQVSNVSAPTTTTAGQQITVTWQVANQGPANATGNWQDSVYLSPTGAITSNSILLGAAQHNGGLNVNGSYNGTLSEPVPALAPGSYYVLVQVDSLYQVSDPNRANNTSAAASQVNVSLPPLVLGTAFNDSFTAADQDHYYQVTVPAGGALTITLQSAAASGATALYVSAGTLPTPYNAQESANVANQPSQTVVVPQVLTAGTYYILAHSVSGTAATAGFTLTATQSSALTVSAISSYSGGNAGNVTIEIDGANFAPAATASLTLGAATINATTIDFVNGSQLFATFNLTGAAAGSYTMKVQQGAQSATASSTFHVVAVPSPAPLSVALITPQFIRSGRTGSIIITYTNTTADDMVAPLLDIASTNATVFFSTLDDPNDFTPDAQVLAVAPSGPAGILRPRQSGQLTLTLLSDDTVNNDQIPVQVSLIEAGQTIDWAAQESSLQPVSVPTAAWNVIFTNVLATIGSTTDSFNAALAQAATYLSGLGATTAQVSDVGSLWSFLVSQADAEFPTTTLSSAVDAALSTPGSLSLAIDRTFVSSIAGRYTPGIFGLGWITSWQTSLSVDSSGNVTINSGGALSFFPIQASGAYLDTDGEYGSLTRSAGVYTFTDTSGTQDVFLPSGLLNYEQDTDGNRIILGYNGQNQLVTLTYSNPSDPSEPAEHLILTYNAQGFVSQEADSTDDAWTYTYDTAGHLLSVTAPGPTSAGLTTSYTYDTGNNPETANALLSITNPDGSQENFSYDALGRLSGATANGGAEATTYTYLGDAEVMAADSAGDQSIGWFNDFGLVSRVQDALGAVSTDLYDNSGNLVSYTDAAGDTYQYSYDSNGNLTKTVNPLGQTVQMTYDSLSDLTSITDADNNTTQYSYSSAGNLLSIAYPDGTQQSFTYDPLGNLGETILQNGDPVNYQYNAQGLVTQENFADGTYETFGYDTHGNLTTAESFSSGGTPAGTTTLTYNAANELTAVSYPGGLSLVFTYNAQGQRTQSVDQSGYTLTYSYDTLGRLTGLSDGSGMVVTYTYNDLGQLAEKQNGNGTYTTYAYDPTGNLTSEINYLSGTTVNSSFTYTYNVLSEMTSMTDASGNVTTYGYDATGQLTQVTLPGSATITYIYNAAGDRTEVINSGTPTAYSSNADNEITQVGSATYTYDANGNLASVTDANGTTTYSYNDQNQLVSITNPDGSVQSFQYSPLGFLVGTSTTTGTSTSQTSYLVDATRLGNVVSSYDKTGSLIAHYNLGIGLASQTGPSGPSSTGYYDFDGSGNTVGITGPGGTYVNQYSYLPFGETTTTSAALPNPFTFAGQAGVIQVGANLFYMRARDYTPATGQFMSNDPIGLAGMDTNIRRYAGNAPTSFVDPSGTDPMPSVLQNAYAPPGIITLNADGSVTISYGPGLVTNLPPGTQVITNPNVRQVPGVILDPYVQKPPGSKPFTDTGTLTIKVPGRFKVINKRPKPKPRKKVVFVHLLEQPADAAEITDDEPLDPNALIGPAGFGTQNFIKPTSTLPYTVDFENDGSVAAQDVTVTEQLDLNLNWSTFQLGSLGFGPVKVTIPAGLTQYQTTAAYQNTDGSPLNVKVSLDFNVQTGLLSVTFTSLAPLTGQAPNGVFDGFLPPDDSSHVGEGFVQYTVQPKSTLATSTTINQQASVVFDTNDPLATNTFTNTVAAIVNQPTLSEPAGTTKPAAEKITSLLGTHFSDADGSKHAKPGIAVIATSGAGTWQFSTNGTTWVNIGAVETSSALLLPQADQLRFLPAGLGTDPASLFYVAWDGSSGSAGHYANASVTGGGSSFSANAGELDVTPSAVTQQAPIWLANTTTLTPVLAGTTNPPGETVQQAFDSVFSGDNSQSAGIAVIGVTATATQGTWKYALFNSTTQTYGAFQPFTKVSAGSAVLLGPQDMIQFVPAGKFAGAVSLTVRAWDGSSGNSGDRPNLSKSTNFGGKTAFSSIILTAKLYVNQAPTQNPPAGGIALGSIAENTASKSVTVATLLSSKDAHAADLDKGTLLGMAITGNSGPGTWQYELPGSVWQAIPSSLSAASVLLLPGTAMLRFVPAPDQSGSATLSWDGWDGTQGTAGAAGFPIAGTGGATAFSSAGASVSLTVKQSQQAPAWTGSSAMLTPAVPNSTPAGDTVASVFAAYFASSSATVGIAVSGVTGTANGTWQYSTDGTNWVSLNNVKPTYAVLLAGDEFLRFLPKAGFLGTASLTAHAWAANASKKGQVVNLTLKGMTGGTSDISSATLIATCLVNTAPELSA